MSSMVIMQLGENDLRQVIIFSILSFSFSLKLAIACSVNSVIPGIPIDIDVPAPKKKPIRFAEDS